MSLLWAIRHAPVQAVGLCYGRSDVETAIGHDTAAARVLAYGPWSLDRVWSSPSARCHEPAARIAAALAVPLVIDERLYELDFGAWEGLT
ncbi:MAG TPA: histidine phosphatase family protein, partial [Nannocystis sp.]